MCFPSLVVSSPLLVVVSQLHFNICSPVLFCSSCPPACTHPLSLMFLVCSRTYTICSQSRLSVFFFCFSSYLIVIICHSLIIYFVAWLWLLGPQLSSSLGLSLSLSWCLVFGSFIWVLQDLIIFRHLNAEMFDIMSLRVNMLSILKNVLPLFHLHSENFAVCFHKNAAYGVIKCYWSLPNADKIFSVLQSACVWVGVEATVIINP